MSARVSRRGSRPEGIRSVLAHQQTDQQEQPDRDRGSPRNVPQEPDSRQGDEEPGPPADHRGVIQDVDLDPLYGPGSSAGCLVDAGTAPAADGTERGSPPVRVSVSLRRPLARFSRQRLEVIIVKVVEFIIRHRSVLSAAALHRESDTARRSPARPTSAGPANSTPPRRYPRQSPAPRRRSTEVLSCAVILPMA